MSTSRNNFQFLNNPLAIRQEIQRFESVHPSIYAIYDLIELIGDQQIAQQVRDHVVCIEGKFPCSFFPFAVFAPLVFADDALSHKQFSRLKTSLTLPMACIVQQTLFRFLSAVNLYSPQWTCSSAINWGSFLCSFFLSHMCSQIRSSTAKNGRYRDLCRNSVWELSVR